jgi:hypothetical protein
MGNEPEPVLKSELLSPIEELANSIRDLSDRCDSKRQILLHQAISRTKWQKGLHIASGAIALLSGGAVSASAPQHAGALLAVRRQMI